MLSRQQDSWRVQHLLSLSGLMRKRRCTLDEAAHAGDAGFLRVLTAWLARGEEGQPASAEASVAACAARALRDILAADGSAKKLLELDGGSLRGLLAALRQAPASEVRSSGCR